MRRSIMLCMALVFLCTAVVAGTGCERNIEISTGLGDDVIFRLSESECSLSEIILLLVNEKNRYEKDFGTAIWDKGAKDSTMEDSVKLSVKDRQIYIEALYLMAQDKKIELTEAENESLKLAAGEYYSSLSDDEIEITKASEEDVYDIYKKSLMSEKLYELVTGDLDYEVSDEEARVMSAMYIFINGSDEAGMARAEEAYSKVQSGADFYNLALEYSDDYIVQIELSRGAMVESVEEKAFELLPGEYTDIIAADKGFYIVKCVEDYLKDRTDSNKAQILRQMKNKEFLGEFEPFLKKQKLNFNDKLWESIRVEDYSLCTSTELFEVYDKYISQ